MMGWWLRAVPVTPGEHSQEIDAIYLNTKTGYVSNMAAFIAADRQNDFSWDWSWLPGSEEPESMKSGDGWAEFGKFRLVLVEDGVAMIEGQNDRWIFVGPALPQSIQQLRGAMNLW